MVENDVRVRGAVATATALPGGHEVAGAQAAPKYVRFLAALVLGGGLTAIGAVAASVTAAGCGSASPPDAMVAPIDAYNVDGPLAPPEMPSARMIG